MKLQYTNVTKDKEGKDVTETREITAYTNMKGQMALIR